MSQPMIGELTPHPPSGTDPDWLLRISLPPGCVYWFRDGQVTQSEPMRIFLELLGKKGLPCLTGSLEEVFIVPLKDVV